MKKIILASASPRRKELLARFISDFEIIPADIDEYIDPKSPVSSVMLLALEKAMKVAADHPDAIVIGADTIVLCDNKIYGKPHTIANSEAMLGELCGKSHNVCTGVAAVSLESGFSLNFVETSEVKFTDYSTDTMRWYISTGEGLDKAGSYAIQGKGCILVDSISGDYDNIVGLPVAKLIREFAVKNVFLY